MRLVLGLAVKFAQRDGGDAMAIHVGILPTAADFFAG